MSARAVSVSVLSRRPLVAEALASGLADQELLELAREQAGPGNSKARDAAAPAPRRTREHDELAALVDEALRG